MSELPDAKHIQIYSLFQGITLVLSTILVCTTLFVVAKVSPKNMGVYQMYIYNEVIASYAFDAGYLILQPVTLLPFSCAYSVGPLRHTEYVATQMLIKAVVCLSCYKFMSLMVALFYRYLKSLPPSRDGFQKFLGYPKWFNTMLLVTICLLIDMVLFWSLSQAEIPQDRLKSDIAKTHPTYYNIVHHEPSLVCYWVFGNEYGGTVIYFIVSIVVFFVILTMAVSILAYRTVQNFMRTDKMAHVSFQRTQRRLLVAWALQMASIVVFVGLPFLAWLFMLIVHPVYENILILVALCVIGMHSMAECVILLIVVKPYRLYLMSYLCRNGRNQVLSRVKFFQGNSAITDDTHS